MARYHMLLGSFWLPDSYDVSTLAHWCTCRCVLYESLQLAHKCILNSFYGAGAEGLHGAVMSIFGDLGAIMSEGQQM